MSSFWTFAVPGTAGAGSATGACPRGRPAAPHARAVIRFLLAGALGCPTSAPIASRINNGAVAANPSPAARNCRRPSVVGPCPASWLWQLARWCEIASLVTPSFPGMFFFIALCSVIKLRANLLRVDVAVARPLAPSVVILLESAGCPPGHSSRVHACVFTGGFGFVWKLAALAVSAGDGNRWGKARFPFGTIARNGWDCCSPHRARPR